MRAIGTLGVLVSVVLLASACSSGTAAAPEKSGPSGPDIVIGLQAPVSGPFAADGASASAGASLAIDAINDGGGVLGRKLSLKIGDDQGQAAQGPIVAQKLISDGAVAIVGGSYSGPSLSSASAYQRAGIPMVTAYAVHPDITKVGDLSFRIWPVADVEGAALVEYAQGKLKSSKVAILNLDNDFGVSLMKGFSTAFTDGGGKVVAQRSEQVGTTDFSSPLTTIKAANPDSLFVAAYYTEAAQIVKQARSIGIDVPIFGAGFDSPLFLTLAGDAANDVTFISDFTTDSKDAKVLDFVKAYKAKTGKEPDSNAASSYDSVLALAAAIKTAKGTKGSAIGEALHKTEFTGVTGKVGFTSDREVRRTLFLNHIEKGVIKAIGQIKIGDK